MQIELHKTTAAKPQAVFRTIVDIVNWPRIIRSVAAVELLTPGRVRVGTRVRVNRVIYGHEMIEELEVETFERPHRLRLVGESRGMHYERDHVIDSEAGPGRNQPAPCKTSLHPSCRSTCVTNWSATWSILLRQHLN